MSETAKANETKQLTLEVKEAPLTDQFFIDHIMGIEASVLDIMYEHYDFNEDGFEFMIEFKDIERQLNHYYTDDHIRNYIEEIYDHPNDYNEYMFAFPLGVNPEVFDYELIHDVDSVQLFIETDFYYQTQLNYYELVLEDTKWKITNQQGIPLPSAIDHFLRDELENEGYSDIISIYVTEELSSFDERLPFYKGEKDYPFEIKLANDEGTLTGEFNPLTRTISTLNES